MLELCNYSRTKVSMVTAQPDLLAEEK